MMTRVPLLFAAACLAALVARSPAADEPKPGQKDADRLQGTWKVAEATAGGKEVPPEDVGKVRFTFAGEKLTFDGMGDKETGSYKLDVTTSPRQIDMLDQKGEIKSRGIYKFDGKDLIWCYAKPASAARPDEFRSKPGSGVILMRLKPAE